MHAGTGSATAPYRQGKRNRRTRSTQVPSARWRVSAGGPSPRSISWASRHSSARPRTTATTMRTITIHGTLRLSAFARPGVSLTECQRAAPVGGRNPGATRARPVERFATFGSGVKEERGTADVKPVSNAPTPGPLVLIADDDAVTRAVVETWLVGGGYEVIAAPDGDAALALALEMEPDLAVLDVSMPGLDGLEVCRALSQAMPAPPPVIFLTGHSGTDALVTGLDAGAVDYIVKPLNRDVLIARVRAALRSKALRDDLITHATRDALTGLLNRRELDARTRAAIAHAQRYERPLSCAMIDVDHFKAINDRHGHAAGDAALCEAATRLQETCRETDTIGRYGGEEFIVLFPEISAPDAMVAAERIRRAFCDAAFTSGGVELQLTASIGVATWDPNMSVPASLYSAADRALYQAKESGRNRAELFDAQYRAAN